MVAEKRFRKLSKPELLKEVYEGTKYKDGIRVEDTREDTQKEAAA